MACQKMANGFATTEELAGRAGVLMSHEGMMLDLRGAPLRGLRHCQLCVVKWQSGHEVPPVYPLELNGFSVMCFRFSSYQKSRTQSISAALQTAG